VIQYLAELILLISFGTVSVILGQKLGKLQSRVDELESDVTWLNSRFKRSSMRRNREQALEELARNSQQEGLYE
jgi:uncharacterized protein YoxC